MTGPNRENIKRRLGHALTFITGKAYIRKADMAESPLGWSLGRGLHPCAQQFLPEYGPDFQVHVQTPFKKLNLYTATLTVLGEDEPLLHTKFCPSPVDALSNLRIMIMVCEDPDTKDRIEKLREVAQRRGKQRVAAQKSDDDPFREETNDGPSHEKSNDVPFEQRSSDNFMDDDEMARKMKENAMREEADLAREQWEFTVAHLAGKKARRATQRRKRNTKVVAEDQ